MDAALAHWIATALDHTPRDPALFERALTHRSRGGPDYERLEFLGDRVLGLVIAAALYERHSEEPEGRLSMRLNALVSRESCAEIGRAIGVPKWLILGKQAREDGAQDSDNVVGDVVEALVGALFVEGGLDAATRFVRHAWEDRLATGGAAPRHPKSLLQEWAAANQCKPPVYTLSGRSGPHHAPLFTVTVAVSGRKGGEATATGSSKQEAETAAAAALLAKLH